MYIKKTFRVREDKSKKLIIGRQKRKEELFKSYKKISLRRIISTTTKNVHLI